MTVNLSLFIGEPFLTSTHNLSFEQNMKNIRIVLSEHFPFLAVKFSIYLNRRVFVMNKASYSHEPNPSSTRDTNPGSKVGKR